MDKVKRLFTVGDGYCFNHYWPMWSQLLAELLECEWTNFSIPGLGNEAIANIVSDSASTMQGLEDLWIIQWAEPHRFDLNVTNVDTAVIAKIETDPVYYKNYIKTPEDKTWWSSSASTLPFVALHKSVLSAEQLNARSRLYQHAVASILEQKQVNWQYIFTYNSSWSSSLLPSTNVNLTSLEDFSYQSSYKEYDVGEIQPVSSIHLDFLEQFILPKLQYDSARLDVMKQSTLEADIYRKAHNTHLVTTKAPKLRNK